MFRRRKNASGDAGSSTASTNSVTVGDIDPELQDKAQDVMKDNLELMKDIVMRVRDDPEFAKGIYKDCPRLQHLLEQYPDLRPIFEDPKLVKINFEQVYREAGGVLPEDEEKKKRSWLVWIVNSPIFKVLKLLLFVKKLVACIAGGGFAFVSGLFIGCCFEDALEELDGDADADGDGDADMDTDPNKEALNRAGMFATILTPIRDDDTHENARLRSHDVFLPTHTSLFSLSLSFSLNKPNSRSYGRS